MPVALGDRLRTFALALLTGLLLVGCGSTPSAPPVDRKHPDPTGTASSTARPSPGHPPATSASPRTTPRTVAGLTSAIVRAVDQRDHDAFAALVSDRDAGFADTAGMIFDNLQRIQPEHFALRPTGEKRHLGTSRAEILGPDAYAVEVKITWALPGESTPSDQRGWMTVLPSTSGLRWAGISDGPSKPRPTPLWWLAPVQYAHRGGVTAIAGQHADLAHWVRVARTAISNDLPHLHTSGWNKQVVIIVPDTEQQMEKSLGVEPGEDTALAALTWADGSEPDTAPIRIMINPDSEHSDLASGIVLSHELVHVATRSPTSPAPTWLVEGYADYIAYLSFPDAAPSAAADLLAEVKRHGAPHALPNESDFSPAKPDLNQTYAEAWLACRYLADRFGAEKLWRFYAAVDNSPDGSIASPAVSAFGISEHELVNGWQHYLRRAAKRGRI